MNIKSIFGSIGDVLSGIAGVLTGLVSIGVLSSIIFGSDWLGIDVVANISALVGSFLGGGLTGLLTFLVVIGLWESK